MQKICILKMSCGGSCIVDLRHGLLASAGQKDSTLGFCCSAGDLSLTAWLSPRKRSAEPTSAYQRPVRHSIALFKTSVTRARRVKSEATAKAAVNWYSL